MTLARFEVVTLPQLLSEPKLSVPGEDGGEDEEEGVEPDGGHHHQVPLLPRHHLAGPGGAQTQTPRVGRHREALSDSVLVVIGLQSHYLGFMRVYNLLTVLFVIPRYS